MWRVGLLPLVNRPHDLLKAPPLPARFQGGGTGVRRGEVVGVPMRHRSVTCRPLRAALLPLAAALIAALFMGAAPASASSGWSPFVAALNPLAAANLLAP